MLSTIGRSLAAAVLLGMAVAAAAGDHPVPSEYTFAIEIPRLSARALEHRVKVMAGLVQVPAPDAAALASALRGGPAEGADIVVNDEAAFIGHHAESARTSVVNKRAQARGTFTAKIVSEKEARALFQAAIDTLVGKGVVEARRFDLAKVEAAHTYGGLAKNPQPLEPRILAYNFEVYRAANGIPFYHNRISVTIRADGLLSEIELGGPELGSTFSPEGERPLAGGRAVARRQTAQAARSRLLADHPGARIQAEALAYAISENDIAPGVLVEPRFVISWNEELTDPQNPARKVITRPRELAYRLDDPQAAPSELR
jgi:hypothetical protein